MDRPQTLEFRAFEAGDRLDRFLHAVIPEYSRAYLQQLIREGAVRVDGEPARAADRLRQGSHVVVAWRPPEVLSLEPEELQVPVLYADEDIVVVNKPAGLVVHPAPGAKRGTLVNALIGRYPEIGNLPGVLRPGVVHRLDKDTSGVIVVARTARAYESLVQQFKGREVDKRYLALVQGELGAEEGSMHGEIRRDPVHRMRMSVAPDGRVAETRYRVLLSLRDCALVEVTPKTGRTHQIRVHFAAAGHPIVGDRVYGRGSQLIPRQFLHAWTLAFHHPGTGERVEFAAPLPEDLGGALHALWHRQSDIPLRDAHPEFSLFLCEDSHG
jgi:23S rRNA pseudouridine1911/1915/1917 synthase